MKPTLATTLILVIAACGSGAADGPPTIVVSIPPQAYLVERIAGDAVRVITLVTPGESPATYQPTDQRVSDVMRAVVYFRIGVPFERGRWLGAISQGSGPKVVDVRDGVDLLALDHDHHEGEHECGEEGLDPHIWLSPRRLIRQAETMTETLVTLFPERAGTFRENASELRIDLIEVGAKIERILAPHRGRRFFIFHPSFGYFAHDYGLEQISIELEGKNPSEAELTDLVRRTKEDGATVIFVQPEITGQAARAVAEAVGAEVRTLDPLAKDIPESLLRTARALASSFVRAGD